MTSLISKVIPSQDADNKGTDPIALNVLLLLDRTFPL
jgi:hypothetical protein